MKSRHAALALLVAIALFCCTSALAGSVEIGFVDDAELAQWRAGAWLTAEAPTGETACTPAKFNQTSACWTVVIFNGSSEDVKLEFTTSSEEFAIPPHQGMFGPGPLLCYTHLEPGESCFQQVVFWPRTGEVYHGTIRVTASSSNGSTSRTFRVKGTSDYPPDLQAAEEVRQRHEAELKAIPHVASVELDNDDLEGGLQGRVSPTAHGLAIKINVTVMNHDHIEAVRKLVPPKIEGYDTEVTDYTPTGGCYKTVAISRAGKHTPTVTVRLRPSSN